MLRKALMLCGAGLVLNSTGCALLQIVMIPIQILISIFGFVFDGIDNAVESVARVESIEGPAPVVERLRDGRFRLDGIAGDARFAVVCEAPGAAPRRYVWPDDLAGLPRDDRGVARVDCVLVAAPPASTAR